MARSAPEIRGIRPVLGYRGRYGDTNYFRA